ncbi:hypothetical protein [Actinoplanes sp. GCM10030250]|uniref:hypothetical protein n=1 Tax=Actinoplanes sp. GCM10030250 TaxID=3273376 RepID=UPI003611F343
MWEAERDAYDAARALAGMAALLRAASRAPADETDQRMLLSLAQNGEEAAQRVVSYLRDQRGAGDGEMATVPSRLAPWRDWVPTRGHLFGASASHGPVRDVSQPRCDPGE